MRIALLDAFTPAVTNAFDVVPDSWHAPVSNVPIGKCLTLASVNNWLADLAAGRHALEFGVNWIDTAAVYGLGHSEEVVGHLLRERQPSERPMVFTKCGLTWDANNPMAAPRFRNRNLPRPRTRSR